MYQVDALIRDCSGRVAIARPANRKAVVSGGATVAPVTGEPGQAPTSPVFRMALVGGRPSGVAQSLANNIFPFAYHDLVHLDLGLS